MTDIEPGRSHSLNATAEACSLPGGSDMPGTVVQWTATGSDGETSAAEDSLPDFGATLEALVQSIPDEGTTVEPGQQIELRGMAVVVPPALGISKLSLRAGDQLIQEVANVSETSSPVACDYGRYGALNRTHYIVPENPPAIIRICAHAEGFDGTVSDHCIEFYTGEVWKGTATITSTAVYPEGGGTCRDGWALEFTFAASPEGTIDGQGTADLTSGPTCPFPIDDVPSAGHVEYQVLGEKTAGGFSLRFALAAPGFSNGATLAGFFSIFDVPASPAGGPPVAVAVSGTNGTGQGTWQYLSEVPPPAKYSANGTITLECVASCEPAS